MAIQSLIRNLRNRGCEADGSTSTPVKKAPQSTPKSGKSAAGTPKTPRSRKKKADDDSAYEGTPSKRARLSAKVKTEEVEVEVEAPASNGDAEAARAVALVESMDESNFTVM